MTCAGQNEAVVEPFSASVRHYEGETPVDLLSDAVFPIDAVFRAEVAGAGLLAGWIDRMGVAGLVLSDKVSWTVQIPGRAVVVRRAEVDRLLDISPSFSRAIRSWLLRACEEARHDAVCLMPDNAFQRVVRLLTKLDDMATAGSPISISQAEIGTLLGFQRTTVSGVMARLRDMNVINYRRGRVSVVRTEAVSAIA